MEDYECHKIPQERKLSDGDIILFGKRPATDLAGDTYIEPLKSRQPKHLRSIYISANQQLLLFTEVDPTAYLNVLVQYRKKLLTHPTPEGILRFFVCINPAEDLSLNEGDNRSAFMLVQTNPSKQVM